MLLFIICHDGMAKLWMCMKRLTFLTFFFFFGETVIFWDTTGAVSVSLCKLCFLLVNSPLLYLVAAFPSVYLSCYETLVRPVQKSLSDQMLLFIVCHVDMAKLCICMNALAFLAVFFLFRRDSNFLRQKVWWGDRFVNLASCMWTHLFFA